MKQPDSRFVRTLRGEQTQKVPFWEIWFLEDGALCTELLGAPITTVEQRITAARKFGWETVRIEVEGLRSRLPVAYEAVDGDHDRYSHAGGLHSLSQLDEIPPVDVPDLLGRVTAEVQAVHAVGLTTIAYLPWCFHATNTAMGLQNFAYKTVDDIDFLHTVMEFVEQRNQQIIREILIPAGIDVVLFDGDCAYKNGLMISPRVFRELVFERTARTVALLQAQDIPYLLHSDGKLDDLIPILIELGFSGVHGVEAMANDLAEIKARFGDQITLIGNMDITFLGYSSLDEVRARTREMLDIGTPGGRYIAACNTSPEDFIPPENYLTFVETILTYEKLPQR